MTTPTRAEDEKLVAEWRAAMEGVRRRLRYSAAAQEVHGRFANDGGSHV
jgi:hypothetical protein